MEIEYGKLAAIVLGLISITLLGVTGHLTESAITGMFGVVMGYVFGNGRLAAKGKEPQPLIKPKRKGERRRPPAAPDVVRNADPAATTTEPSS